MVEIYRRIQKERQKIKVGRKWRKYGRKQHYTAKHPAPTFECSKLPFGLVCCGHFCPLAPRVSPFAYCALVLKVHELGLGSTLERLLQWRLFPNPRALYSMYSSSGLQRWQPVFFCHPYIASRPSTSPTLQWQVEVTN